MELLPADYVLCALTLILAVTGLFRGLSGTLAFLLASVAATFAGLFAWPASASYAAATWSRGGLTLLAALLAFGFVRLLVKRFVRVLLAQPSDALLGLLVGAAFGATLVVVWAHSGMYLKYSNLAQEVAAYIS